MHEYIKSKIHKHNSRTAAMLNILTESISVSALANIVAGYLYGILILPIELVDAICDSEKVCVTEADLKFEASNCSGYWIIKVNNISIIFSWLDIEDILFTTHSSYFNAHITKQLCKTMKEANEKAEYISSLLYSSIWAKMKHSKRSISAK